MPEHVTDKGLIWRPLVPFGAEVSIDLSGPLSDNLVSDLLHLLNERALLLFRRQTLSMERQTWLMRQIGPIVLRPQENGYISTDNGAASRTELSFHADAGYTEAPFAALSLHAVDVIDGASSTRFVSAEHAYAALPAGLKAVLDGHDGEMISPTFEGVAIRACDEPDPPAALRTPLPAIRINPRNGRRCIGVSEMHTAALVGFAWEDSRVLLGQVFDRLYAAENELEHVWQQGDLLIWDNLSLQHARGSLENVGRRVLQRVVAASETETSMEVFRQAARL